MDWQFSDTTLDRLNRAGVEPLMVIRVLTAPPPRVRRHMGAGLQVAAPVGEGRWLAVSLIEEKGDRYVVTGARWLDADEVRVLERFLAE